MTILAAFAPGTVFAAPSAPPPTTPSDAPTRAFVGAWLFPISAEPIRDGVLVVDGDDPGACAIADAASGRTVLRCSLRDRRAEVFGLLRAAPGGGAALEITSGDELATVRPPLSAPHNAKNLLLAVAAARGLGFPLASVAGGLQATPTVPGRMERIDGAGFEVVVDYAHTPDAFDRVLAALRAETAGRLIVVFGCGGDKDRGKRPLMGRAAETHADRVFLTADNPRSESCAAIAADVVSGMRRPEVVTRVVRRADAIVRALESARPGDCVALLGKGHETEQVIGGVVLHHDDRAVARAWIHRGNRRRGASC